SDNGLDLFDGGHGLNIVALNRFQPGQKSQADDDIIQQATLPSQGDAISQQGFSSSQVVALQGDAAQDGPGQPQRWQPQPLGQRDGLPATLLGQVEPPLADLHLSGRTAGVNR